MSKGSTVIVTGASQGIGAEVVKVFLGRGYNVLATSRSISAAGTFKNSKQLQIIDGDIGLFATAERIAKTAVDVFGSINALVNNAGVFFTKPFIEYTQEDIKQLISTNVLGFLYITQFSIKQMLKQKTGGSIVSITSSMVDHPILGVNASVPMVTKGGVDAISLSLAIEYVKEGIRVNTIAPGVVDTPLHKNDPKDILKKLSPMGTITDPAEIAAAVLFLTESQTVTGEVLHVDGGAHLGQW
jgi:NAD(P)-dependent dehydrogenase (short-subunit alcohol dehydrogenase family)